MIVKNIILNIKNIEAEIAIFLRIFWASKSKKLRIFEPHFGQVYSYKKNVCMWDLLGEIWYVGPFRDMWENRKNDGFDPNGK